MTNEKAYDLIASALLLCACGFRAVRGSGKYRAGDLRSETVTLKISGSGNDTVWATESLDARITGSVSASCYGKPGVHSRTQAVARARAWGVLASI